MRFEPFIASKAAHSFSTWMHRIACNVFLNYKTRGKVLHPLPEDHESRVAAAEQPESARRCDMRRDVAWAISSLEERYRRVIVLYYLEEVSYPEIAKALNLPLGTIKTHLFRARGMLRRRMTQAA